MKKMLALLMSALLVFTAFAALAEDIGDTLVIYTPQTEKDCEVLVDVPRLLQSISLQRSCCFRYVVVAANRLHTFNAEGVAKNLTYLFQLVRVIGGHYYGLRLSIHI